MIGISAKTAMENGSVLLDSNVQAPDATVTRAQRSATLDTGAVVSNYGVSHGDETYTVRAEVDEATYNIIDNIQRNQSRVTIATRNGVFSGIIKSKTLSGTTLRITLWIESRLEE